MVSPFIFFHHLVYVVAWWIRFLWYVMSRLMISYSMILDLYGCHRSCCVSAAGKSILSSLCHLVDVIDCRMRFLWYLMSPLMMSYSMIFDVSTCHRSCCASSQSVSPCIIVYRLVDAIECRIRFLWYVMSPLINDLIFDDLWCLCLSTLVMCVFRR